MKVRPSVKKMCEKCKVTRIIFNQNKILDINTSMCGCQ